MQEIVSTITSKGQVTIPAAVRRHLGVDTHDKIAFILEDDGRITVTPLSMGIEASYQAIPALPHPLTDQEMTDIAWDEHADKVVREGS